MGDGEWLLNGPRVLFWSDGHDLGPKIKVVIAQHCECTLATELFSFKWLILRYVNFTCFIFFLSEDKRSSKAEAAPNQEVKPVHGAKPRQEVGLNVNPMLPLPPVCLFLG